SPRGSVSVPTTRRDGRVAEGARLESDAGQRYQSVPPRVKAHAISDLALPIGHSVCVRAPGCSARFRSSRITVLSQITLALGGSDALRRKHYGIRSMTRVIV